MVTMKGPSLVSLQAGYLVLDIRMRKSLPEGVLEGSDRLNVPVPSVPIGCLEAMVASTDSDRSASICTVAPG